jgi:hypothetical protein
MKKRANNRKKKRKSGSTSWSPKIRQKVLLKTQPLSGAGVTAKFMDTLEGPHVIPKIIEPSTYEVTDVKGKVRGQFNKRLLKGGRYICFCQFI